MSKPTAMMRPFEPALTAQEEAECIAILRQLKKGQRSKGQIALVVVHHWEFLTYLLHWRGFTLDQIRCVFKRLSAKDDLRQCYPRGSVLTVAFAKWSLRRAVKRLNAKRFSKKPSAKKPLATKQAKKWTLVLFLDPNKTHKRSFSRPYIFPDKIWLFLR